MLHLIDCAFSSLVPLLLLSFQTPPETAGVSGEQRRQLQNRGGGDHRPAGGAGARHGRGEEHLWSPIHSVKNNALFHPDIATLAIAAV